MVQGQPGEEAPPEWLNSKEPPFSSGLFPILPWATPVTTSYPSLHTHRHLGLWTTQQVIINPRRTCGPFKAALGRDDKITPLDFVP